MQGSSLVANLMATWRRQEIKRGRAKARDTAMAERAWQKSCLAGETQAGASRGPDGNALVSRATQRRKPTTRQESINDFFAAAAKAVERSLPNADAAPSEKHPSVSSNQDSSSSVQCVGHKEATEAPVLLEDFMECFSLRIVDVPSNGYCFYGAFCAATSEPVGRLWRTPMKSRA